jgi:hypothetical protein
MEDLFDTYEAAKAHLEIKKAKLYKDITDRGDVILEDRSFVGHSFIHTEKLRVYMLITTQSMIDDLKNFKYIDPEEAMKEALKSCEGIDLALKKLRK